ncbi:MAG: hypothetical protein ACMG6S_31810 [Byssovorax sp.]
MNLRLTCSSLLVLGLAACAGCGSTSPVAGGGPAQAEQKVRSFARVTPEGEVLGVGVIVPVTSFESVPSDDEAFQGVGIEMPPEVRDRTFIQFLRINWLASGHGPSPYGAPHFDLHFYRGTNAEIDAIDCSEEGPFSAAILSPLHQAPTLCVSRMGYHAWPIADLATNTFGASIILGYYAQKMVFIEPMITRARFLERSSFEVDIARPESAGGATTLYPSHLTVTYDAATDSYRFEFDHFETID